jgi:hypothetical protein
LGLSLKTIHQKFICHQLSGCQETSPLTVSTMSGAHVNPPNPPHPKDKDTSAIEQELSKDIETLSKVPSLISIGLEYASHI